MVKKQFTSTGTKSLVLNALALLVESGSIYCALLVLVPAFRVSASPSVLNTPSVSVQIFVVFYEIDPVPFQGSAGLIFARVAACFVYGCIMPLMVSMVTHCISCHAVPGE